ncbi:hypothetical protein JCM33374_g6294 [Metschnikowia sp. JCM 33374]|nr:hypothetical protein JCM33374_g6294 [Metschnikowia sp. JCM 33374]
MFSYQQNPFLSLPDPPTKVSEATGSFLLEIPPPLDVYVWELTGFYEADMTGEHVFSIDKTIMATIQLGWKNGIPKDLYKFLTEKTQVFSNSPKTFDLTKGFIYPIKIVYIGGINRVPVYVTKYGRTEEVNRDIKQTIHYDKPSQHVDHNKYTGFLFSVFLAPKGQSFRSLLEDYLSFELVQDGYLDDGYEGISPSSFTSPYIVEIIGHMRPPMDGTYGIKLPSNLIAAVQIGPGVKHEFRSYTVDHTWKVLDARTAFFADFKFERGLLYPFRIVVLANDENFTWKMAVYGPTGAETDLFGLWTANPVPALAEQTPNLSGPRLELGLGVAPQVNQQRQPKEEISEGHSPDSTEVGEIVENSNAEEWPRDSEADPNSDSSLDEAPRGVLRGDQVPENSDGVEEFGNADEDLFSESLKALRVVEIPSIDGFPSTSGVPIQEGVDVAGDPGNKAILNVSRNANGGDFSGLFSEGKTDSDIYGASDSQHITEATVRSPNSSGLEESPKYVDSGVSGPFESEIQTPPDLILQESSSILKAPEAGQDYVKTRSASVSQQKITESFFSKEPPSSTTRAFTTARESSFSTGLGLVTVVSSPERKTASIWTSPSQIPTTPTIEAGNGVDTFPETISIGKVDTELAHGISWGPYLEESGDSGFQGETCIYSNVSSRFLPGQQNSSIEGSLQTKQCLKRKTRKCPPGKLGVSCGGVPETGVAGVAKNPYSHTSSKAEESSVLCAFRGETGSNLASVEVLPRPPKQRPDIPARSRLEVPQVTDTDELSVGSPSRINSVTVTSSVASFLPARQKLEKATLTSSIPASDISSYSKGTGPRAKAGLAYVWGISLFYFFNNSGSIVSLGVDVPGVKFMLSMYMYVPCVPIRI